MLFNSYEFVLAFLPVVYLVARWLVRSSRPSLYLWWLVLASVTFYSWQSPRLGLLFVTSMCVNYAIAGRLLAVTGPFRLAWLWLGVTANLAYICYFKYLGFAALTTQTLFGGDWTLPAIALPLGISFYTFQQIAYLVDVYRGDVRRQTFVDYVLFVSFFPQLIAGPIVQQSDIVNQFAKPRCRRFHELDAAVGLTLFILGLFKKVVLADNLARFANPAFRLAEHDGQLAMLPAWLGMLSYTLQLYFDFSGYSDMALGLGRLFGIRLPLNFNSPYKSVDIIDFWRRWHLTLSAFLRDYLYLPLGGGRCSRWRKSTNLLLTMLLGGLWHGAGWTFVLWGGVHGLLLIANHAWNDWQAARMGTRQPSTIRLCLACVMTTFVVSLTWVLFRAESCAGAASFYHALFIPSAATIDYVTWVEMRDALYWVPIGLVIVWLLPNSQETLGRFGPALRYRYRPAAVSLAGRILGSRESQPHDVRAPWWQWQPTTWHATVAAAMFLVAISSFSQVTQFIYFNF